MTIEITLPELGEGADSADVVRVMVSVGDTVTANQSIIELESDKATVEVPSPQAGTVTAIAVGEGDTVNVGQVILTLDAAGGGATAKDAAPAVESGADRPSEPAAAGGDRVTFVLPNLGEGADEGDVVGVLVKVGERVEVGQSIIEVESDKASVEVPSDVEGVVVEISVGPGDTVRAGQAVMVVEGGTPAAKPTAPASPPAVPASVAPADPEPAGAPPAAARAASEGPIFAAPSVRTLARARGIDIRRVPGSGPAGRISKDDVERFAAAPEAKRAPEPAPAPAASQPVAGDEREKMPAIRRTIAQRMTESWQTIPHVTLYRDADATDLEAIRKRFKPKAEARGTKLTITAILVKICAMALRRFPNANSSVDMTTFEIVRHGGVHVGVAADTDRGLVVPVVRDADQLGILDIAVRLNELAEKARSGKLEREEMTGATFSVSNLGGLGIGYFTPIINPPEVAILGVGRGRPDAEGRIQVPLSLSTDHRMLDGADGARFLQWIVGAIEDPVALLFD